MQYNLESACKKAVELWGYDTQAAVAIEELLEAALVVQRFQNRGRGTLRAIAEELADVKIVLHQMEWIIDTLEPGLLSSAFDEKFQKFINHIRTFEEVRNE